MHAIKNPCCGDRPTGLQVYRPTGLDLQVYSATVKTSVNQPAARSAYFEVLNYSSLVV